MLTINLGVGKCTWILLHSHQLSLFWCHNLKENLEWDMHSFWLQFCTHPWHHVSCKCRARNNADVTLLRCHGFVHNYLYFCFELHKFYRPSDQPQQGHRYLLNDTSLSWHLLIMPCSFFQIQFDTFVHILQSIVIKLRKIVSPSLKPMIMAASKNLFLKSHCVG